MDIEWLNDSSWCVCVCVFVFVVWMGNVCQCMWFMCVYLSVRVLACMFRYMWNTEGIMDPLEGS